MQQKKAPRNVRCQEKRGRWEELERVTNKQRLYFDFHETKKEVNKERERYEGEM